MEDLPYPLREHAAGTLRAASGRPLNEITEAALDAGELTIADTRISAATLLAQAEVARRAGYPQLAENLARAAELTAVPNTEVLRIYDRLRPGRATHAELLALAELLEREYSAHRCAGFIREAAAVYLQRGLLRKA
ncbi:MAG: diol dehydratase small subunit [Chloroflexi bacterium OHK40]